LAEGSPPGEHLAITLPGGGEASRFDDPILFVDDRCDVQILMSIDAANDATLPSFHDRHPSLRLLTITNGFTGTECTDRTITRP
jgi:hypothetical protein